MSIRESNIAEKLQVEQGAVEEARTTPLKVAKPEEKVSYTFEETQLLIEQWRHQYNESVVERLEEMERHTWRNDQILRGVTMVAMTAIIGIVIASGVVGAGKGSHWSGPAWNTMWLYGLFAANAVSMFWTTHKE
jgi:hypothetical protein